MYCVSQQKCFMIMCFIMLFQARYTMGNTRVGRLQYNDADLGCALVHVDVHPPSDSDRSYSFRPDFDIPQSSHTQRTNTESPAEEKRASADDSEPADPVSEFPSGLRKRNVLPTDSTTDSSDHDDGSVLVDDMKKLVVSRDRLTKRDHSSRSPSTRDPLHWFGILIPMPLRQSQAAFRRAIDVVCQIASLQSELLDIRKQYHTTLKAKHRLSASVAGVEDS